MTQACKMHEGKIYDAKEEDRSFVIDMSKMWNDYNIIYKEWKGGLLEGPPGNTSTTGNEAEELLSLPPPPIFHSTILKT
jgi:hypothetical protein